MPVQPLDVDTIPLVVQSPAIASLVMVMVEGEAKPRAIPIKNMKAGQNAYFYGDLKLQKPYLWVLKHSGATPVTGAMLGACVPDPLQPSSHTWTCATMVPEEGMAMIAAALEECGGDPILASEVLVAHLESGETGPDNERSISDQSNIMDAMVVQSPADASVAMVYVAADPGSKIRAVFVRKLDAGQPLYIYGDFVTQTPYVFREVVPMPLRPTPDAFQPETSFGDEEKAARSATIAAYMAQSGGDAVLASALFVAQNTAVATARGA